MQYPRSGISAALLLLVTLQAAASDASSCLDPLDTYADYDNRVRPNIINPRQTEQYLLSYSWAPGYCQRLSAQQVRAGTRDYLQCGSGRQFGYILHGLWPQGSGSSRSQQPRACEGDQPKIPRATLEPYLCMTPSVWLLQHEYEFHGTCMHDESLESPKAYLDLALRLHRQLELPRQELPGNAAGIQWWLQHNPHLTREAIRYSARSREWQFCYDTDFQPTACTGSSSGSQAASTDCPVKGNISSGSGKRYYFTSSHPNHAAVRIDPQRGERCFDTEQAAEAAGWQKAP